MSAPRVLIVRFSALGDVILTTPVMLAVREAHPDAHITFVTKEAYAELMTDQACLDHTVALRPGESVPSLAGRLSDEYDFGLDLQGSTRSRLLRVQIRANWTSIRKPRYDRVRAIWLGRKVQSEHMVDRYLAAARALTHDSGRNPALMVKERHVEGFADVPNDRLVVLAPGAAHRSKKWHAVHWLELAHRLREGGWTPVVTGLESDAAGLEHISALPAWHLSLVETVALIARSRLAVTHDSGLMHAAAAVGTPVITLFGPTSSGLGFAPRGEHAHILERDLPCRPCSAFGTTDCPAGHHKCLENIAVDDVISRITDVA